MNPRLSINLGTIGSNVRTVLGLLADHGLKAWGVTKVTCGDRRVAEVMAANGADGLADSHPENLAKLEGVGPDRWMIRIPAPSECDDIVRSAEGSLVSDRCVLRALERAAAAAGRTHQVVLMLDLGDLREGFWTEEGLLAAANEVRSSMPHLVLRGVGVNLTCFSFVQPETSKLERLVAVSHELGLEAPLVSGGNSATLDLMMRGGVPHGVTHLRLGESLLFGRERARYQYLPGTRNDAFMLTAEVVECREKPSMPVGTIGVDSYGVRPTFEDRGTRLKAICNVGKQSIDAETMWPVDPGVQILGASSDHLMLDVTDLGRPLAAGDLLEFRLGYFATMRAFTSPYVERVYVE